MLSGGFRFAQHHPTKSGGLRFAQHHPTRKKGSRTPADALFACPHASGVRCAPRKGGLRRPPLAGALACRRSTDGSRQRDLSSRRLGIGPGFPKGGIKGRTVPHAPPVRSQRCTSRAGPSAGRHDARAARVRTVSFRPRAPRSLRRQGVPSRKASFKERDGGGYDLRRGKVKGAGICTVESECFPARAFLGTHVTPMIRRSPSPDLMRPSIVTALSIGI